MCENFADEDDTQTETERHRGAEKVDQCTSPAEKHSIAYKVTRKLQETLKHAITGPKHLSGSRLSRGVVKN